MKVVVITPWYSKNMGYAENFLPAALALEGAETHVVTSNAQIYCNHPDYKSIYEPYLGPAFVECGVEDIQGYRLHRLPHKKTASMPKIKGLYAYLKALKPDVIQTFEIDHSTSFTAALYCILNGAKLFTECHVHASVMVRKRRDALFHWLNFIRLGLRLTNIVTKKCYPIAPDVEQIAINHYKVPPSKIEVQSLGVDTSMFRVITGKKEILRRITLRKKLGIKPSEVLCIYTGRFTASKNPFLLGEAIEKLGSKSKFRALFIGAGDEASISRLNKFRNCIVHKFVQAKELPQYYQAADIGVWPKEESTSQLDAVACGLPIIISDRVKATERIQGNGLQYIENNSEDLARQINKLSTQKKRVQMGQLGAMKIIERFSWRNIAKSRLRDYAQM